MFNGICSIGIQNDKIKEENMNNIKTSIISHSIDDLIDKIANDGSEDLILNENDIIYQITTTSNQMNNLYNNLSTINLGECENILKKEYNINHNNSLLILKIDIFKEGYLIPFISYDLFDPITKKNLNLSFCANTTINLIIPVNIKEDELFKYNISNDYYKDMCSAYTTDRGTDIIIKDRQNEYLENNLSLCENDCELKAYNKLTKKVTCDCYTKINLPIISEIKIDKNRLKKNFIEIKNIINLTIMKCYKTLFTKNGLLKNIGNYILLSIIFIYLINMNFFFLIDYFKLYKIVKDIINIKKNNIQNNNK